MKNALRGKLMETDLYQPIYDYLTAQGYSVYSEVKNCDITAVKGEELVIIELKTSFNATLLMQATKRQRASDSVYVAIPLPKGGTRSKNWSEMCHLLKRLELGLITVCFKNPEPMVEVMFHPMPIERKKSKNMRRTILREISGRHYDLNEGGSTRKKLMTAYRENAVHIACCFERFGPMSAAGLRKLGTAHKTLSILSKNFYGWFEKVEKGIYTLHPDGRLALQNYPELVSHYNAEIDKAVENQQAAASNKLERNRRK